MAVFPEEDVHRLLDGSNVVAVVAYGELVVESDTNDGVAPDT
jgi:hypothetical protein